MGPHLEKPQNFVCPIASKESPQSIMRKLGAVLLRGCLGDRTGAMGKTKALRG